MPRIEKLFEQKKQNVLNVYCTAGYPHLNSTTEVLKALQNSGVDLIELGMPYSDPLADGPVIQASGLQALQNGMTIATLFEQLKDFRKNMLFIEFYPLVIKSPSLRAGCDSQVYRLLTYEIAEKRFRSIFKLPFSSLTSACV